MGDVYLAEHVVLGKRMAVKVLKHALSQNEELVRRFQNAAIATKRTTTPASALVEPPPPPVVPPPVPPPVAVPPPWSEPPSGLTGLLPHADLRDRP